MDVIDGITLQFMANMSHYHKYLEKNEASQTAYRDLAFYKERFLSLTRSLCDERTLSSSTGTPHDATESDVEDTERKEEREKRENQEKREKRAPRAPRADSAEEDEPPSGKVASKVNDIYPIVERPLEEGGVAQEEGGANQDVHQDVHDAFNRFVDASVAYFQFSDRSVQLQHEYDDIPEPSAANHERENKAPPFDVNEYQMKLLVNESKLNQKKCVLDAFVSKGRSGKHHMHAKKIHDPRPSRTTGEPDNDGGLL
jgi:hypothetical protein